MCDILQLPTTHSTSLLASCISGILVTYFPIASGLEWDGSRLLIYYVQTKICFRWSETYFQLFGLIDWKRNDLDFNTFKEESVHRYTLGLSLDNKLLLLTPEFYPLHDISQIVLLPQVIIHLHVSFLVQMKWISDPLMLGKQLDSPLEVWSWFSKLNLYAHKQGG